VQTPKWNLAGLARYQWPVFDGGLALSADFNYRSKTIFNLSGNDETSSMGDYAVVNSRLSYGTEDEKWELAVFVNNLFDREYRVQHFDTGGDPLAFPNGFLGVIAEYYGRPRWVGGSVRYRF
jgi:iron complex outermembrane receptor protein